MIEIKGAYNTAVAFTGELEPTAQAQIRMVCDQAHFAGSKIRIMPDVHAGKGCTIGTTMTLADKVVPNMVGVDIGCGMETARLSQTKIDFVRLDKVIRTHVPSGRDVRDREHPYSEQIDLGELRCKGGLQLDRARKSIGSLGGGNHFIEVDKDEEGALYLVVHSGSRHLGTEIADWYQQEGFRRLCGNSKAQISELVAELKRTGREKEIATRVKQARAGVNAPMPKDMAYVEGELFDDYIHDMRLTQAFAVLNRKAMVDVILREMGLRKTESFTTIHNYIDTETMILRKGAVSARAGEQLLIPINMRDGALLCTGLGNDDWNQSAPHGAGRLMSRAEAMSRLSLKQFREEMQGIYSTSVSKDTLDESPMAYKNMDDIVNSIGPTVRIEKIIRPVYNFKASE